MKCVNSHWHALGRPTSLRMPSLVMEISRRTTWRLEERFRVWKVKDNCLIRLCSPQSVVAFHKYRVGMFCLSRSHSLYKFRVEIQLLTRIWQGRSVKPPMDQVKLHGPTCRSSWSHISLIRSLNRMIHTWILTISMRTIQWRCPNCLLNNLLIPV
jgi:hypothetical protein